MCALSCLCEVLMWSYSLQEVLSASTGQCHCVWATLPLPQLWDLSYKQQITAVTEPVSAVLMYLLLCKSSVNCRPPFADAYEIDTGVPPQLVSKRPSSSGSTKNKSMISKDTFLFIQRELWQEFKCPFSALNPLLCFRYTVSESTVHEGRVSSVFMSHMSS